MSFSTPLCVVVPGGQRFEFWERLLPGDGTTLPLEMVHYAPQDDWPGLAAVLVGADAAVVPASYLSAARLLLSGTDQAPLEEVALLTTPRLLFYRTDLFEDRREQQWFREASGGNELRLPTTWDDLAVVAQHFTRAGRLYGFAFPGYGAGLVTQFAEIVAAVGGSPWDAEGSPRFFSRAGEWSLNLLCDLYRKWKAVPEETPDCNQEDVADFFRRGECALLVDAVSGGRLLCDTSSSAVAGWHSVVPPPGSLRPGGGGVFAALHLLARGPAAPLVAALQALERWRPAWKEGHVPADAGSRDAWREELFAGTLAHLKHTLGEQALRRGGLATPQLADWPQREELLAGCLRKALMGEMDPVRALAAARDAWSRLAEQAEIG